PEQAAMTSQDIDTRSDIYSLGVLLYELLTGSTPFDTKVLLASGLPEMQRALREVEPPRPSTRLTQELVAGDVRRIRGVLPGLCDMPSSELARSERSNVRAFTGFWNSQLLATIRGCCARGRASSISVIEKRGSKSETR